jgi:hypothetical protein
MNTPSNSTPQFATAEYRDPAKIACKFCQQAITGPFYRVNGAAACASCAQRLQQRNPADSHSAFVRGLLFGIGAAILGFAIYVIFALSTGLVIGFVSLAVGYLVGKGIGLGSRGVGGRRYQIAAALLTYMAVSLAAVPIALSVVAHKHAQQHQAQSAEPGAASAATPAPPPRPRLPLATVIGRLTLVGLASPFLDLNNNPEHGIIGLIILLVGVRIAWQLTAARPLAISGPLEPSAPPARA